MKSFQRLDPKKAAQKDIKINILKKNGDFLANNTCYDINDLVRCLNFPNELKRADIVPVHKKSKFYKKIYRPISILSNVSKTYDRSLYDQIGTYFEHIFSRYQCGFRKVYSSQHCLLAMIKKCKKMQIMGMYYLLVYLRL